MNREPEARPRQQADDVYQRPATAEDAARDVLGRVDATPDQRSEALATLGRSAYYDNRLTDAIAHLERALSLASTPTAVADISLTLAPALSKVGRADDALERLQLDVAALSDEQRGKLQNQRGIIHVETGELPEALEAFRGAREIHRAAGDTASEGRVLVNMAAAASELGRLQEAEAWYADAWRLTKDTGQDLSSAIIEGNLGYVASRRGDFSAALEWYQRGRSSFSQLGDVDLLVAVLETDHATTLLDLGLNAAAHEAATYARSSSIDGSNRMLEIQALLLEGEAQLRLGQFARAERSLTAALDAANELDVRPLQLRSDYLIQRLRSADGRFEVDPEHALDVAAGLRTAGWHREALRTLGVAAQAALDADDPGTAGRLLDARWAAPLEGVDALDVAHADALHAYVIGDDAAFSAALLAGERELERERQLVNSAELETRLGHRMRDLRELAMRRPVESNDPLGVLRALDRTAHAGTARRTPELGELRSQLRDVRVGIQEAQLAGVGTDELSERAVALERRILRAIGASAGSGSERLDELIARTAQPCVAFLTSRDRLHAVTTGADPQLVDLAPIDVVRRAIRTQRVGLRRMALGDEAAVELAAEASARLSTLLVDPLELTGDQPIAIVTDAALAGLSWSGIDGLRDRAFVLAPSIRSALTAVEQIDVSSVALITAGDLEFADAEIDSIAAAWHGIACTVCRRATLDDMHGSLRTATVVHVAAHGTFRADNPFVSAFHLVDGDLRLLDLERQERLPRVVVLASCDSGAATEVGSELVGAAEALLSIGVRTVFAASVILDDEAAALLAADLHRELAGGASPARALHRARSLAFERGTARDRSAGEAFVVYGDASAVQPLSVVRQH